MRSHGQDSLIDGLFSLAMVLCQDLSLGGQLLPVLIFKVLHLVPIVLFT